MKKTFLLISTLLPVLLFSQCSGSFLTYDHMAAYFIGNASCWTCDYNLIPVVAIQETSPGRAALVYFRAEDTTGNIFAYPVSAGGSGVQMAQTYINGDIWWGTIQPAGMGVTAQSWYFGSVRWVTVIAAAYNTSCIGYTGKVQLSMKAKTYTPGIVGDTCYYDSTKTIIPCTVLAVTNPDPIQESIRELSSYQSFDILGRKNNNGLKVLILDNGDVRKVYQIKQ